MKSPKETALELLEGVKALAAHAEKDVEGTAVMVFVMAEGEIHAGVAGSPIELSKLVARAMNADDNVERIIMSGAKAAPFMAMFEGVAREEQDAEVCDCPNCTARRKAAAANPNVN